ncbi:MAG: NUDIX domain-containing protein [Ignavibacteriales bacterium]|nr:NUDIX domain-containing protein [Ignavibacteriales bacterium]
MVSGSIHDGEMAYQTALREILEETNLKPKMMWVVPNVNSFYSPEKNYVSLLPIFVVRVDPNSKVRISNEHTEYKWVSKNKAKKNVGLGWST